MNRIAILTPEELRELISDATAEGFHKAQSGNNEPVYYSPAELAEKFPFQEATWQGWIRKGLVGKITRTGRMMATYKEAEEFLFVRKK